MKKFIFSSIIGVYIILLTFAYFASDNLIFPETKVNYKDGKEFLKLTTADGTTIYALYLPNKKAKYTVLVSHGNHEDIGKELSFLHKLHDHDFAVFAYDYHGYGLSGGKHNEKNTYSDVNASYDYLTKKLHIAPENIIDFGYSLGSGPALDLAVREPVAAVILQGAFITTFRVMTHFPIVPFDKFDNLKKISELKYPLLIIHGTADKTVPFWHGQELYKAANEPKQFYRVEKAGHLKDSVLAITGEEYWTTIKKFLKAYK